MDAWDVSRYRRPLVNVDRVELTGDGVSFFRGQDAYDIETGSLGLDPGTVRTVLEALRRPDTAAWSQVRARSSQWTALVDQLDEFGLIKDDDVGAIKTASAEWEAAVRSAASWIRRSVGSKRSELSAIAQRLLKVVRNLQREQPVTHLVAERDFFGNVLVRQLRCWQWTAPPAFAAATRLLLRLSSRVGRSGAYRRSWNGAETCLFEPGSVRVHLASFAVLLAIAAVRPERTASPRPRIRGSASGINAMLAAERHATDCLRRFGETKLARLLRSASVTATLARLLYVEQYHLAGRYVQILAPLLCLEMRKPLRDRVLRYHAEEVGHESLEREAALAVGVTDEELADTMPLPLFSAYLDVLTDMARHNPIGLLMSLVVAEGFPGAGNAVNAALALAGLLPDSDRVREHEQLNAKLNHSFVARLLLSAVPAISAEGQRAALCDLGLVVELNCRAWNMLVSYGDHGGGRPFQGIDRSPCTLTALSVA